MISFSFTLPVYSFYYFEDHFSQVPFSPLLFDD